MYDFEKPGIHNPWSFQLAKIGDLWDTANMDDEELRASIMHDLVAYRLDHPEVDVTLDFLLRFIQRESEKTRVFDQLFHPAIAELIVINGDVIAVDGDQASLQVAMDIAGTWWDGFNMPDDAVIFQISGELEEVIMSDGIAEAVIQVADRIGLGKDV